MAKTSLHTLTAAARLPGVSEAFLYYKTITQIISDKQTVNIQEWFHHIRTYSVHCTTIFYLNSLISFKDKRAFYPQK